MLSRSHTYIVWRSNSTPGNMSWENNLWDKKCVYSNINYNGKNRQKPKRMIKINDSILH